MEKNVAIKVENLSKAYQLGQIGTGTISRDLERFWTTKIRGKEDPFLKIGEANDRSVKGESNIVWSLKDINFEIEQGDAFGIIGRNGAGKSTLLKLLSRVTAPTTGNIKVKGRIASLLEVGTGFHPELTGRENIYLNGAILGMRKKEITRKFDEIVDFSGVERYIDTPVKRYSSGMYVRLAFAVAAHLESEILIVDEVLAVGDAEFQKKCLGKMGDVSKGEGRTVLFVSHNMSSINSLCQNALLLVNGTVKQVGLVSDVISSYVNDSKINLNRRYFDYDHSEFRIESVHIYNVNFDNKDLVRNEKINIEFQYRNNTSLGETYFNLKFKNELGDYFLVTTNIDSNFKLVKGSGIATMLIPAGFFNDGIYTIELMVINFNPINGYKVFFHETEFLIIKILPEKLEFGSWMEKELGQIRHSFEWSYSKCR